MERKPIAINRAVQFYPNADAVYWTDARDIYVV